MLLSKTSGMYLTLLIESILDYKKVNNFKDMNWLLLGFRGKSYFMNGMIEKKVDYDIKTVTIAVDWRFKLCSVKLKINIRGKG